MEILLFVGIAVLAVGGIALSLYLKAKRRQAFATFARSYGLQYSPEDPFGLVAWPFRLFGQGEGRGAENVVWGPWQVQQVVAFDYWYYERHTDSKGHPSDVQSFLLRPGRHPRCLPHASGGSGGVLHPPGGLRGPRRHRLRAGGIQPPVERQGHRAEVAYELIDSRMIRWLVQLDQPISFEVAGSRLLAYQRRVAPTGLAPLIGVLLAFRERIPRVAWTRYPAG